MLKELAQTLILGAAVVGLTLSPLPARAGGVIIDGRVDDSVVPSDADDPSPGDSTTQHPKRGTPTSRPLTEDEQAVYLYASMVFNGHDAATKVASDGRDTDSDADAETTGQIIDALEDADAQGGCAAAPVTGLAAIAGLALLRHRRRR